jgi:hypothetical protein
VYETPQQPELLNASRMDTDDREFTFEQHRDRAAELAAALRDSCAYGEQLWQQLVGVREYLAGSVPAAQDDARWRSWSEVYAAVVGTLAGPHGDSGFGADEARQIMRGRREFPPGQEPTLETIVAAPVALAATTQSRPRDTRPWSGKMAAIAAGTAAGWIAGRWSAARVPAVRRRVHLARRVNPH